MSDAQQSRPPSSLTSRSFRDVEVTFPAGSAEPESSAESAEPAQLAKKQTRKLPVIAVVLFMVLTLGAGTAMLFAGTQETAQEAPIPEVPDLVVPVDQEPVGMDGVEPPAASEGDQEAPTEQTGPVRC